MRSTPSTIFRSDDFQNATSLVSWRWTLRWALFSSLRSNGEWGAGFHFEDTKGILRPLRNEVLGDPAERSPLFGQPQTDLSLRWRQPYKLAVLAVDDHLR